MEKYHLCAKIAVIPPFSKKPFQTAYKNNSDSGNISIVAGGAIKLLWYNIITG
jgi:hypothetical protein